MMTHCRNCGAPLPSPAEQGLETLPPGMAEAERPEPGIAKVLTARQWDLRWRMAMLRLEAEGGLNRAD